MDERTLTAVSLFDEAIDWLRQHYGEYEFWAERDLVWTVQTPLRRMITERRLPQCVQRLPAASRNSPGAQR